MYGEIKKSEGRISVKTEHGEAELLYRKDSDILVVYHVFTPPDDRGQGIAEKLADTVVDLAKKEGLRIIPECSYMQAFLNKHKELKKYEMKE